MIRFNGMDFMDLYQHGQIKKAHRSVGQVAEEIHHQRQSTRDEVRSLHDRIDRLVLVCEALWGLLASSGEFSENDLVAAVNKLDGEDGSVDGVRTRQAKSCACGAKVGVRLKACQFCGRSTAVESVFEAI